METSESVPESAYVPDPEDCQRWAESALQLDSSNEASLRVVSRGEMQALNRDYRGKDKPTNILSFPMQVPEEVGLRLLGDLAACAEVIETEAREQGKSAEAHWAHMIVHGMLHLQGYDHIEPADAERMEATEIAILRDLGFNDPYNPVTDDH